MRICDLVHGQVIALEPNGILETVPEGRVARAVYELVIVHEETLRAYSAVVAANVIGPPVLAREGTLHGAAALRDVVLVGRHLLLQLRVILLLVLVLPVGEVHHRVEPILEVGLLFLVGYFLNDIVALDLTVWQNIDVGDFVPDGLDTVDLCGHPLLNVAFSLADLREHLALIL